MLIVGFRNGINRSLLGPSEKNKDPKTHAELRVAYEVLKDPFKRNVYDEEGTEGLKKL